MFKLNVTRLTRNNSNSHYPAFILLLINCCIIIINPVILYLLEKLWMKFVVSIFMIIIVFFISLLTMEQFYSLFRDVYKDNPTLPEISTNFEIKSTEFNFDT